MGSTAYAKLDSRALARAVETDAAMHQCPTPDCKYVTWWAGPEDGPPALACPLCKHEYCLVCGARPYHTNKTCAENKAEVGGQSSARGLHGCDCV